MMNKKLVNGKEYQLTRNVMAYKTIGRDWNLTGTPVRTQTDNAGNHARITGILQYGHTKRGNINYKRALVRLSDVANHTLYAWIDADSAEEIKMKKNPRRRGRFTQELRDKFERGGTQAYKGYLITFNAIHSIYYISKEGFNIGSAQTISEAKAAIDMLTNGAKKNPRRRSPARRRARLSHPWKKRVPMSRKNWRKELTARSRFLKKIRTQPNYKLIRRRMPHAEIVRRTRGVSQDMQGIRMRAKRNPQPSTRHVCVQVRKGMGWHTFAMFPATPEGKKNATFYAKLAHRRYPSKSIRVMS